MISLDFSFPSFLLPSRPSLVLRLAVSEAKKRGTFTPSHPIALLVTDIQRGGKTSVVSFCFKQRIANKKISGSSILS